ncbi:MAG TPA: glycosyltransferase family 2 protein [Terriglobia bacterium]|nr:glycosyltransferase family 2 protein [Terriglobia bacterium]
MPEPHRVDISVIVVSWNSKGHLERCLESLTRTPCSRSVEIIVVDNGSADGSPEMVESRFPQARLIRNRENLGFAKANNQAIRVSRGRYISLVNSDVEVLPGCLDKLAEFLDQNPKVGNVGPRVLNPDRTLQSSCRRFPSLWNNFCSAAGLATLLRGSRLFCGEHMRYFRYDRTLPVDVLVGCFWMMRREALESVGPLDEEFFIYAEDVDWCRRCRQAGWEVVFFPGAEAIHHRAASSAADPVRFAVLQQESVLRYWAKHHGFPARVAIRAILMFHHLTRCLLAAGPRRTRSAKAGRPPQPVQANRACLRALLAGRASYPVRTNEGPSTL